MKTILLIAALAFTTPATAATNLITDGGFENPKVSKGKPSWQPFNPSLVPGWGGSNDVEIWNTTFLGVASYEGIQHAELNSTGNGPFSLYQDITTVAGQNYQFSFAYRARANSSESFRVAASGAGGDLISTLVDDHVVGQWSTYTDSFIATNGLTTISFTSVSPGGTVGNFLDDVRVSAVPLPAAAPLFASALGLLGFLQSRRRRS
jgi:hypothetical protein